MRDPRFEKPFPPCSPVEGEPQESPRLQGKSRELEPAETGDPAPFVERQIVGGSSEPFLKQRLDEEAHPDGIRVRECRRPRVRS